MCGKTGEEKMFKSPLNEESVMKDRMAGKVDFHQKSLAFVKCVPSSLSARLGYATNNCMATDSERYLWPMPLNCRIETS